MRVFRGNRGWGYSEGYKWLFLLNWWECLHKSPILMCSSELSKACSLSRRSFDPHKEISFQFWQKGCDGIFISWLKTSWCGVCRHILKVYFTSLSGKITHEYHQVVFMWKYDMRGKIFLWEFKIIQVKSSLHLTLTYAQDLTLYLKNKPLCWKLLGLWCSQMVQHYEPSSS